MTQDEIFDAARQSHLDVYALGRDKSQFIYRLEAFAKLVEERTAAKEREACAKVCDEREKDFMGLFHKYGYEEDSGAMLASMQCAKAIRAKGEA